MQTPGFLWLYLVIAFGCLVLLAVAIRVNFQFVKAVQDSCTCHKSSKKDPGRSDKDPKKRMPRFETTKIWGYIGIGSLATLLILLCVALVTEVTDVPVTTS